MSFDLKKWIAVLVPVVVCLLMVGGMRAAGETGELIYTASNTIDVVNIEQGDILKEIPLQHFVTDMVFAGSRDRAYIAASNGVAILDTREHSVVGHLDGPPAKNLELSPDQSLLYVLEHPMIRQEDGSTKGGDYQVNVIDLSTGRSVHTFVLGKNYFDIHLTADGSSLYAMKFKSNTIDVIDTNTWQKNRTITVNTEEFIWRSVGSREKGELYIPQFGTKGYLWILDTKGGDLRKVELHEELPLRGITYSPRTDRLYLLSLGHLLAVDVDGEKVVKKATLDIPYQGMSCSNDGKHLYLTNPIYRSGGSVTVMDAESLEIIKVIDTPSISPIMVAAVH